MTEEPLIPEDAPLPQYPPWGFPDVLLCTALGFIFFLAGLFLVLAIQKLIPLESKGLRLLLAQFGGYLFAIIPVWLLFHFRFEASPAQLLRMAVSGKQAIASFSAGLLTAFGIALLALLLRMPRFETPMEELLSDTPALIAAAILGVTLGPWFEELFFRGLLQPVAVRYAGPVVGILISALPFALLHGPQYGWSWRHLLLITLAGCAFGFRRHRTGSTGAATIMHSAYNLLLFAGYIAGRSAGADLPSAF